MLKTLLKIGKWQQSKSDIWSRHLDDPKVQYEDRNGNEIKNYIVPLIFDLDDEKVYLSDKLSSYQENHKLDYKLIKVQGGRVRGFYASIVPKKLNILIKTFFGDIVNSTANCEILSIINELKVDSIDKQLVNLLADIRDLKNNIKYLDSKYFDSLINNIELTSNEKIVFLYACVKSKKHGFDEITPISKIDSYIKFLELKLDINATKTDTTENNISLCYASGKSENNVSEIYLTERKNINKMFVTTTQNYLNNFNNDNSQKNYGVSKKNQELLDLASKYILKNNIISIANIKHVVIPEFFEKDNIDFDFALDNLMGKSDLLFSLKSFSAKISNISDEVNNILWLNFYAFESDGNFFKATNLIKDVSEFHFNKVLNAFYEVDKEFRYEYKFMDWNSVMTEYGNNNLFFNLYTIYKIIPIKEDKDKEKRNYVFNLFKMILENRKIEKYILFQYFSELMLCYYYQRYKSYTNINASNKDYLSKNIRDSVFKYLAFIMVLKKLNLINMEEDITKKTVDNLDGNKYDIAINSFFEKMGYNNSQKALFYLGRMLNTVEYIQKDKNKTVIDKVNFNGMEKDSIIRLRTGLIEKAKQYSKVNYVVFDDAKFTKYFDFNNWSMDSKEALFFILSGYSFGAKSKEENNSTE